MTAENNTMVNPKIVRGAQAYSTILDAAISALAKVGIYLN